MTIAVDTIATALLSTLMGVAIYLTRTYFDRLHSDIAELKGSLSTLGDNLHKNTIAIAKVQGDVKALWRFADGAFGRVSDRGGSINVTVGDEGTSS
jgi:hypothetical protein